MTHKPYVSAGLLALLIPVCSQATALQSTDVGTTSAKVAGHRSPTAVASLDALEVDLIELLSQAALNEISYLESDQPGDQKLTFLQSSSIDPLGGSEPQISQLAAPLTIDTLSDGTIYLVGGVTDPIAKVIYRGQVIDVSGIAASVNSGDGEAPAIAVKEPATFAMGGIAFLLFAASLRRSDKLAKRRQMDLEERGRHRIRLVRQEQSFPDNGKSLALNQ
jgi:hypothetical protein